MAGHSQFKNIMYRKGAQDAKKAKQFAKLVREIAVAAKTGGADPQFNPRLRTAIAAAKSNNLPKDRIDNAIKKSSFTDSNDFEEIIYECYGPGGVALIIEVLTDSRSRALSEVKSILNKNGGTFAEQGSVLYMFDRVGVIEFSNIALSNDAILEIAIESGADECISDNSVHFIRCSPDSFHKVREFLTSNIGTPDSAKLEWKPKNTIIFDNMPRLERAPASIVNKDKLEKLLKLISYLDDCDDVQNVCSNHEILKK